MATTITRSYQRHHVIMGETGNPDATKTRIVHISDTHLKHDELVLNKHIPDGDILVHSGDFNHFQPGPSMPERDLQIFTAQVNSFFDRLPHKHKIFVPGNHDLNIDFQSWQRMQTLLTSCIYLQDVEAKIEGIRFYGSGWNLLRGDTRARCFSVRPEEISGYWDNIPTDTEILVTHSPPYAILDCSYSKRQGGVTQCAPTSDCGHGHIGCPALRGVVLNRVRPKVHLFGHCHGGNFVMTHKGVLFSNATMCVRPAPVVIDYYRKPGADRTTAYVESMSTD